MGWLKSQQATAEADGYDEASDQARKDGRGNTAELFADMAVDKRREAQREATGANPRRRG